MNQPEMWPEEAIWDYLIRRKNKIQAVVVTGGEPTLQTDLLDFLRKLQGLGMRVKLDTNGSRPSVLIEVVANQLADYVALDVKHALPRYEEACGCAINENDLKGCIEILKNGSVDYEFRTTVVPAFHNINSIRDIARLLAGGKRYFLQRFQPQNAMSSRLRDTSPPDDAFLETCREAASHWIHTEVR